MDFTGERFIPSIGLGGEMETEHYQRYLSILDLLQDARVLDAACGEGYGAEVISQRAKLVCGLELDGPTVSSAKNRYSRPNLGFAQGSVAALPFAKASFERVVSFETIEHITGETQEAFLQEIKRVMTPDGLLIISTPDRHIYSELANYHNEFHLREFYRQEFYDFLAQHFKNVAFLEQTALLAYVLMPEQGQCLKRLLSSGHTLQGKYIVALCSDAGLPEDWPGTVVLDREDLHRKKVARVVQLQDEIEEKNRWIFGVLDEIHKCQNAIAEMTKKISAQEEEIAARQAQLASLETSLKDSQAETEQLRAEAEYSHAERKDLQGLLARRNQQLDHIQSRLGWRLVQRLYHVKDAILSPIKRPLLPLLRWTQTELAEFSYIGRQRLNRIGIYCYRRLPNSIRDTPVIFAYRTMGPLFSGLDHYERWRRGNSVFAKPILSDNGSRLVELTDLESITPTSSFPGRIGIHLHLFYSDLAKEFSLYLQNMPFRYDLFISVPNEDSKNIALKVYYGLPHLGKLQVEVVPNRGRDMAPMFCTFGDKLMEYDIIAHIQSKKSLYNQGGTAGWREYLMGSLFGSSDRIKRIMTLLARNGQIGLVYPQTFPKVPYAAHTWLANRPLGRAWCRRLSDANIPNGYFDFPAGSMFWARSQAMRPLFSAQMRLEDFPPENGQNDGTLAHCLERLLGLAPLWTGFKLAVLNDELTPSWSRWRFEQYLNRSQEYIAGVLRSPTIKLVIFDIFDTLLTRPLLEPEDIKTMIAIKAGGETGKAYADFRAEAENRARQRLGRDVGLDEIFEEFASLSGLAANKAASLRLLEERLEYDAVTPRQQAIDLLKMAVAAGKRVILASDMFLPQPLVEKMLADHGIAGWHKLYLSNDCGLRKDAGNLYPHIMAEERVKADQIVVIGDNERSDLQIPGDMGMTPIHVLRPLELARAVTRLEPLIEKVLAQGDIHARTALGIILRRHFDPIFFDKFDPSSLFPVPSPHTIGHAILGPIVLSFVQWLGKQAKKDGIERLYFLSREGKFLKQAYDRWHADAAWKPQSEYLVLSRRAVVVPMINDLNDVLKIAKTQKYYPNSLTNFMRERFGLNLTDEELTEIYERKLWVKGKLVENQNKNDINKLTLLFNGVFEKINSQAKHEFPGLLAYLKLIGLDDSRASALVDIGYAATIQGRVNNLLQRPIHGYYMTTTEAASEVIKTYNVTVQGCFGHLIPIKDIEPPRLPPLFRESFTLEKLLRSDEPQIVSYSTDASGATIPEFRELAKDELNGQEIMIDIRRGALDFIDEALMIKDKLLADFTIPPDFAAMLFEAFMTPMSKAEENIIRSIVLDDHYCGRGLVR